LRDLWHAPIAYPAGLRMPVVRFLLCVPETRLLGEKRLFSRLTLPQLDPGYLLLPDFFKSFQPLCFPTPFRRGSWARFFCVRSVGPPIHFCCIPLTINAWTAMFFPPRISAFLISLASGLEFVIGRSPGPLFFFRYPCLPPLYLFFFPMLLESLASLVARSPAVNRLLIAFFLMCPFAFFE